MKDQPYPASNLPEARHGHAKHGSRSLTWMSWRAMRKRCNEPTRIYYHGRGIKICERWNVFEHFLEDMGERPIGMSLERIDNAKDYQPGNCRWATAKEQASNRRSTVLVTIAGEVITTAEASRRVGVKHKRICERVKERGETHQQAIDHFASKQE